MPVQLHEPLIVTLKMDDESQSFFDLQRNTYFPPERNFLKAHISLFHQLPNTLETRLFFEELDAEPFEIKVTGLKNLGAGVAYQVQSLTLTELHDRISHHFWKVLIPQDRQPFRPHITIQNKVEPAVAKALLAELQNDFQPFSAQGTGLDLWAYLGGPWRHEHSVTFK